MLIPKSTGKETYLCITPIRSQIAFNNIYIQDSTFPTIYTTTYLLPVLAEHAVFWLHLSLYEAYSWAKKNKPTSYRCTLIDKICHIKYKGVPSATILTMCFCHKKCERRTSYHCNRLYYFKRSILSWVFSHPSSAKWIANWSTLEVAL